MIGHVLHGSGNSRAIVLHGWLGDWQLFEPMLPALDPARLCFAFMDCRGYGRSRDMAGPYDMARIAADALALADHLGWDRFSLIGHSMGGKAALRTALLAPGRIERICAITPVWAAPAPFDADTLALFRSAAGSIDAREGIIANTTGGRLPSVWSHALAERSLAVSDPAAFSAYLESWAFDDFAGEANALKQETLVIVGAHDRGVPEAAARTNWLGGLQGARLSILPDAGHYPMQECPLILAATVAGFLAG